MDPQIILFFKRWQEKEGKYPGLDIEKVEFEIKRIASDNPNETVCEKRMGFTPKRDPNGDINWFTVADLNSIESLTIDNPDTKEKTTMELVRKAVDPKNTGRSVKLKPIQKGDILVSFKLSVGITKIYNFDKIAYCNEAIDILTCKKGYYNKYIAYNCIVEYPKYGTKTNNGMTLNDNSKQEIKIYIPKGADKYTSYQIQQAIVEFLDYRLELTQATRKQVDSIREKVELMDEIMLPKIFEMKDDYLRDQFDKWAKKKNYKISADDLKFDIKRIASDNPDETVCEKRMGFTPKRDSNGDINWFTVSDLNSIESLTIDNPDTKEKTTMELVRKAVDPKNTGRSVKLKPIQKGDILVSFKLSVGITKIYNSDKIAYCNEAIDILTCKKGYYNKYIAYNCIVEYPKYGTKTNNGMTLNDDSKQEIKIYIPQKTATYSSEKIQHILVDFIEAVYSWSSDMKRRIDSIHKKLDLLDEVILALTFRN